MLTAIQVNWRWQSNNVPATASNDLVLGQTNAGVGLEHVLGGDAGTVHVGLLLLLIVVGAAMAVVRLEVLDQSIDVLIFLLVLNLGLGRGGFGNRAGLLVEATGRDLRVDRGRCRC